jgi:hypothetical protein
MSEEKEKEEVDRAIAFYEALSGYFKTRPLEATTFLHDAVEGLAYMINEKEDLKRDLGYLIGQLHVLTYIIWVFDHLHIIEKMVADPDTHNDIMEAIMKTARAYYLLHSGEPITITNVANLIDSAVSRLYKLLATIINKANEAS